MGLNERRTSFFPVVFIVHSFCSSRDIGETMDLGSCFSLIVGDGRRHCDVYSNRWKSILRAVLSGWFDAIRVCSHVFENFLQFVDSRCRQGFRSSE